MYLSIIILVIIHIIVIIIIIGGRVVVVVVVDVVVWERNVSSDWTLALATVRASDLTGNAASDWWIRRPPGLAETQRSALIGRARMAPLSASNHSRAKERRHGPTDRTVRYRRWFFSRFFFSTSTTTTTTTRRP